MLWIFIGRPENVTSSSNKIVHFLWHIFLARIFPGTFSSRHYIFYRTMGKRCRDWSIRMFLSFFSMLRKSINIREVSQFVPFSFSLPFWRDVLEVLIFGAAIFVAVYDFNCYNYQQVNSSGYSTLCLLQRRQLIAFLANKKIPRSETLSVRESVSQYH